MYNGKFTFVPQWCISNFTAICGYLHAYCTLLCREGHRTLSESIGMQGELTIKMTMLIYSLYLQLPYCIQYWFSVHATEWILGEKSIFTDFTSQWPCFTFTWCRNTDQVSAIWHNGEMTDVSFHRVTVPYAMHTKVRTMKAHGSWSCLKF